MNWFSVSHVNSVNRVHLSGSVCSSHRSQLTLQFLDLVQSLVNVRFGPDQLRERDLRQSVLDNLMQAHDHRTNAAVARVDADIQHPGVRLTEMVNRVFIQNADHFIQSNISGRTRQRISPFGSALRRHQSCLVQNPHQLAGIRDRQPFAPSKLSQGQRLAVQLGASELNQTPQTIFFVGRYFHSGLDFLRIRPDYSILYFFVKYRRGCDETAQCWQDCCGPCGRRHDAEDNGKSDGSDRVDSTYTSKSWKAYPATSAAPIATSRAIQSTSTLSAF